MLEFGSLLRVCRSILDLTQSEMAELLCISQPVYSRIEAGRKPVSVKALQRVADRSGLSIQTLFLAHLLLDENLAALEGDSADGASKLLLHLAEKYRHAFPDGFKDAAALGVLYDAADMVKKHRNTFKGPMA
ncbi:MAG: helix-turn-helix transcriptional regulator [Parvularculaceae bacterium]|nr:helix-turn-helix transcriptional regulator [Parvularculaceae bacterium]